MNTAEVFHSIVDRLKVNGYSAFLEGGGASCPFIEVKDKEITDYCVVLGDNGETWTADIYKTEHDLEMGNSSEVGYIDTLISSEETNPTIIVFGLMRALYGYYSQ